MVDKPNMSSDTQSRPQSRQLGLTTSQAAGELGVSLSTVRRWSDLGYLRSYRTPGGQRRFSREQIESFLASLERSHRTGEDR
jgi:excisionase family DNA binding protein